MSAFHIPDQSCAGGVLHIAQPPEPQRMMFSEPLTLAPGQVVSYRPQVASFEINREALMTAGDHYAARGQMYDAFRYQLATSANVPLNQIQIDPSAINVQRLYERDADLYTMRYYQADDTSATSQPIIFPNSATTDNYTLSSTAFSNDSAIMFLQAAYNNLASLNGISPILYGVVPDPKANIKRRIRSNLLIKTGDRVLDQKVAPAELKAREMLRDMLTEAEWRKYLTNSFIMVKGSSGKHYQIFNKRSEKIRCYEGGKHMESICIHSDERCPPSDHVINMKVLIEIDEEGFRALGNVTQQGTRHITELYGDAVSFSENSIGKGSNLVEEWKSLKIA